MSEFENKYAVKEVFDFTVFDSKGNLIYATESVVKNEVAGGRSNGRLVIEDALFDCRLAQDVINGLYIDKEVRVKGYTYIRNLVGEDFTLRMTIDRAYIQKYEAFSGISESGTSTHRLVIRFYDDFNNESIKFEIVDESESKI